MELLISKGDLEKAISSVQGAVERKNTLPILSNIKLVATDDNKLLLSATDMDIAINSIVNCNVKTAGETTVQAFTFYEIIKKMPDSDISLFLNKDDGEEGEGKLITKSGRSKFSLSVIPANQFPLISEGEMTNNFSIGKKELAYLIDKTKYAISNEETRYYLNGLYFHTVQKDGNNYLRSVATDGHRLAFVETMLTNNMDPINGVIIPKKTIAELRKIIDQLSDNEINISLSATKIKFVADNIEIISKLIDGSFPDYERVIPTSNNIEVIFNKKDFINSIDRVSTILAQKSKGIKISITNNKINISALGSSGDTASEDISLVYDNDEISTGFNAKYLLEVLSEFDGNEAKFLFSLDGYAPVIAKDPENPSGLFVVMPMRV